MKPTVICDLDGTLFDIDHRLYLLHEKRWDEFYAACMDDTPNEWCVELMLAMSQRGYPICFLSGRNEQVRAETDIQLRNLGFPIGLNNTLIMRPRDNRQAAPDWKRSAFDKHLGATEVLFAVDDDARVAEMLRGKGIIVLQCDYREFA